MSTKQMKTLTIQDTTYEVVDEIARESISLVEENLDMDMLYMLHESGIIDLIEDSNGKLYVDENEKLYVI